MPRLLTVAAIAFALVTGAAEAQLPQVGGAMAPPAPAAAPPLTTLPNSTPNPGVTTSRGTGLVTGNPGSPQTIIIPGSAVPGTMMNNGNGTSTILVPGGPSEVVPTPR